MSTAAQDSIIRLSLGMLAADVRSDATPLQREWVLTFLRQRQPLTEAQRRKLQRPLEAYIAQYHPRLLDIVQQQFTEDVYE